jgi:mono/diheme cytochrome c family protein
MYSIFEGWRVFSPMWLLCLPVSALTAAAVLVSLGAADARPSKAVAPPVHSSIPHAALADSTPLYTEEQATAGGALFARICAECHEKKDVAGTDFRAKWTGRALFELYELIRTTMPDSNPGGLSRDEYAGALAYILKLNGLPAGTTAVMPDSAAMQNVKLDLPPPSP